MKQLLKQLLPKKIFKLLQKIYHLSLATAGAFVYRFPSKDIVVIGITGTKGKSSTAELLNAILEKEGHRTALLSTIRFKIGDKSKPNLKKMTMPGRFFVQRFLREAIQKKCTHAIIEMTSEGVLQFRHKHIELDALIFTNISPEHIEAHGSFENYLEAKLKLAKSLKTSPKKNKVMVSNIDDDCGQKFLDTAGVISIPYSYKMIIETQKEDGMEILYKGMPIRSKLRGTFNAMNILAAISLAESQNIKMEIIKNGIESVEVIQGRVEQIDEGQNFPVIVDYAHTPDSLEKLYQTFPQKNIICVLGNTGGGRDTWKRPKMGSIAEKYCKRVILTNEDPYDENPEQIVAQMAERMTQRPDIIMDRREAIREAVRDASKSENSIVLITGKGTDPYIMGAHNSKIPWNDAKIVREELAKLSTDLTRM